MKKRAVLHAFAGLALALCLQGRAAPAHAFAEDVCYPLSGGTIQTCAPLPHSCSLHEPTSARCRTEALAGQAAAAFRYDGGRSLIHTDVTYLIARAVGFSKDDAYWIAAYDEAADLGSFTPRTITGAPAPDAAALTTSDVNGIVRTNFATGGLLFHFVATRKDRRGAEPDGLHPDEQDGAHEIMLAHLRTWALAAPGSSAPLCTAGLTVPSSQRDLATGAACYVDATGSAVPVRGSISVANGLAVPFSTTTGLQVISTASGVRSDGFDAWTGGGARAADARLGIYLHVLGDRISHHRCTDAAAIHEPVAGRTGFREDLHNAECDQGLHALRHLYETGVPFSRLDSENQTTAAALSSVYDELVAFAAVRNVLDGRATNPAVKQNLIAEGLLPALEQRDGLKRLQAVTAVGCGHGWSAFPGAPVCPGKVD